MLQRLVSVLVAGRCRGHLILPTPGSGSRHAGPRRPCLPTRSAGSRRASGLLTLEAAAWADTGEGEFGEFLCPAVANATAALASDQIGGELGDTGNYTFLPGNNQAGAHVPSKALNTEGPGASPGPGDGNSDWSPIWPGDNPDPG